MLQKLGGDRNTSSLSRLKGGDTLKLGYDWLLSVCANILKRYFCSTTIFTLFYRVVVPEEAAASAAAAAALLEKRQRRRNVRQARRRQVGYSQRHVVATIYSLLSRKQRESERVVRAALQAVSAGGGNVAPNSGRGLRPNVEAMAHVIEGVKEHNERVQTDA